MPSVPVLGTFCDIDIFISFSLMFLFSNWIDVLVNCIIRHNWWLRCLKIAFYIYRSWKIYLFSETMLRNNIDRQKGQTERIFTGTGVCKCGPSLLDLIWRFFNLWARLCMLLVFLRNICITSWNEITPIFKHLHLDGYRMYSSARWVVDRTRIRNHSLMAKYDFTHLAFIHFSILFINVAYSFDWTLECWWNSARGFATYQTFEWPDGTVEGLDRCAYGSSAWGTCVDLNS